MAAPRPRAGALPVLGGALLAVFAWVVLARPLPAAVAQPVTYLVQVVTVTAAIVAMLVRARRGEPSLRRARVLVAAALGAGALGGVLATAWHLATGSPPPVPSVADAAHLAWVPLVVAALLSYPVQDVRPGSRARTVLDGAVAAGALWFVALVLVLEPARVGQDLPVATALTALAYPVGDVFVLGALASVVGRAVRSARRELVVTGAGLVLFVLADVAYSALEAQGRYRADSWVSLVAECGLVLVLVGALQDPGREPTEAGRRLLAALPHVPAVLAVVLAGGLVVTGRGLGPGELAAVTGLLALLLLRHAVLDRDRSGLTARLQAREQLWRALVTGSSDLVTLHDPDGRVRYASPALGRAVGMAADDLVGRQVAPWIHPDDRAGVAAAWQAALDEPDGAAECVCRLRARTGEWRWVQTTIANRLDEPGVGGVVVTSRDVHERHVLQQQLTHAAYHDPLTGLGNRARLRQLLDACYAATPTRPATLLLLDLDGFKAVNDTFGHAHGDLLLVEVAARLRRSLRSGDEVTRIGGDEFVLLLAGDAPNAVERTLAAVVGPVDVAGALLQVGGSVGVARTVDAASPDELLRNADLAMYASKESGRNRGTAYAPHMHEAARQRMQVHRGLRRALDEGHLSLHYQPIVSLPEGRLVGAEALLRWEDPELGPVSPEVFIPIAEDFGIVAELDVWVLEHACRDIAAWRAAGLAPPRVSVNTSRRQITPALPGLVREALRRHGLVGRDLCVEVTESAVVPDADAASAALVELRRDGVHVALDDFGTGQSSLSQLARLPVDSVKIDRSFTAALPEDGARRLLTSIVRVCQALSLPVVAEGVEDAEVAQLLSRVGCGQAQGWHFGRPETAQAFAARLVAPVPLPRGELPAAQAV